MAIMNKMREKMALILILLVIAFIITIIFEWGMDYLGLRSKQKDVVGIIDGKKIRYQEFSDMLKREVDAQKQRTQKEPDENTVQQIREQLWNSLVTQILIEKETKKLGLSVTDEEVRDVLTGENPPEFLKQNFIDSTGRFVREAYDNAIRDPRNKDIMVQVEATIRQQRLMEKMQSIILSSVRTTPSELEEKFYEQNVKIDAQYAFFDAQRFVTDDAVSVSEDEIKKFYNENQKEFSTQASRKLKYVLFSNQPTAQDSADVMNELNAILQRAKSGENFVDLQKMYSENPSEPAFFKHGELSPAKENIVFQAKVGDVVGPIYDNDGIHLIKVLEQKNGTEPYIKASHILLSLPTPEKEAETNTLAKEIIARAKKGESFAALAQQYSTDPGSASQGGNLGWFGKGRMVKPFEEAALKGKVGEIVGPVKTQFGLHIIKVEGRDNRELKLADIVLSLKAGSETLNKASQNAQDFAYLVKDGKFENHAKELNVEVKETGEFQKGGVVSGIGFNESINKFAFNNDLDDISEVYQISSGYVVCKISEVKKESVKPLDEVKESIKFRLLRKKKIEKVQEIAAQKRSTLSDNASLLTLPTVDSKITADSTGQFSPTGIIPKVGREFAFTDAAKTLEIGKVSQPIIGTRGYYLIKVLSRTPFDKAAFDAQKNVLSAQLVQQKKQQFIGEWIEKLKTQADIEDNRDQFFR